jgi:uncharacterized membrane protein
MMWGSGYGSGGGAMMIVYLVVTVVVVAAIIVGIMWFIRSQRSHPIAGGGMSAQAVLDARYARGEINETELRQRRQTLADNAAGVVPKT